VPPALIFKNILLRIQNNGDIINYFVHKYLVHAVNRKYSGHWFNLK